MAPLPIDTHYRRKMWSWLTLTVLSGGMLLYGLYRWMKRLGAGLGTLTTQAQYDHQLALMQAGLCLGIVIAGSGLAMLLLKWAQATREQELWPPKNAQSAASKVPKTGSAAIVVAKRLERSAWLVCLAMIAVLVWAGIHLGPTLF